MNIAAFVEALQHDLAAVAGMGDEATAEAARRISAALEPSLRLRLMDVLGEAAVELTSQLPDGHVDVRLVGGDPELVYVEERSGPVPTGGDDSLSARVTLRLPETLKAVIDAAAQEAGVSANTWLLQQISRSTGSKRRGPGGRRMTGYGQS
jgi:HicB-like protein involved in pilus formation